MHYCEKTCRFKIKKTQPAPGVIYLKFANQYECCSTFMRMQEFYESPFKEIRGKHFSLELFMDLYAKQQGNFTYTSDWGGFNVPGHVVDDFYLKFQNGLLAKEARLFDLIYDGMGNLRKDKYYVIGMYDEGSLDHELAHAVYYLNADYRLVVNSMVKSLPTYVSEPIRAWLLKKGYSKALVVDETNAYLTTSGKDELTKRFGKRVGNRFEKFAPFRDAYMLHSGRKLPTASWLVEDFE
jgi:hypothetical protein